MNRNNSLREITMHIHLKSVCRVKWGKFNPQISTNDLIMFLHVGDKIIESMCRAVDVSIICRQGSLYVKTMV